MSQDRQLNEEFAKKLLQYIDDCVQTGVQSSIILDTSERKVEIKIFEAGKEAVQLYDIINNKAKDAQCMVIELKRLRKLQKKKAK